MAGREAASTAATQLAGEVRMFAGVRRGFVSMILTAKVDVKDSSVSCVSSENFWQGGRF